MIAVPQAYIRHLDAVTSADAGGVHAAWTPSGILEFPYATSVGMPARLEGADAIAAHFAGPGRFERWQFAGMQAWKVADASEYVLEMHGSATIAATGAAYEQDYIVRFGLAPDDRLAWMREFWDPTRA